MIKHIVMWKMKPFAEGADAAANMKRMSAMLHALKGSVPQIVELDCGEDINRSGAAFDFALHCPLRSKGDLPLYQEHPEHVKVRDFIGKVTQSRAVADYEIA
jgi:hypothetical protein